MKLLLLLILAALGSTALAQSQTALNNQGRQNAAQQIQALISDKDGRTKAQQKLDSQLIYAGQFRRTAPNFL
jgi:Ni/Co efflux regulator RcnB